MKRQLATFVPQDQKAQRSQNRKRGELKRTYSGSDHTCEVTDFEARDGLVTLLLDIG